MEVSDIIFWISVFIALYGGKYIFDKKKNKGNKIECD